MSFRIYFVKLAEDAVQENSCGEGSGPKASQDDPLDGAENQQLSLLEKEELGRIVVETTCELAVFKERIFEELVKPRAGDLGIHSVE